MVIRILATVQAKVQSIVLFFCPSFTLFPQHHRHTHTLIKRRFCSTVYSVFSFCPPPPPLPPSLWSFIGVQPEMQTLVERRIYPFLLMVVMLLAILSFQIRQFKRLYEHIKNDKSVDPQNPECERTHRGVKCIMFYSSRACLLIQRK